MGTRQLGTLKTSIRIITSSNAWSVSRPILTLGLCVHSYVINWHCQGLFKPYHALYNNLTVSIDTLSASTSTLMASARPLTTSTSAMYITASTHSNSLYNTLTASGTSMTSTGTFMASTTFLWPLLAIKGPIQDCDLATQLPFYNNFYQCSDCITSDPRKISDKVTLYLYDLYIFFHCAK